MGLCLMRMFFCRICCAGMMNVRAMYRFFDSPSMYRFPKLVATCFEIPAEPYRNRGVPRGVRHGHHAVDHLLQGREAPPFKVAHHPGEAPGHALPEDLLAQGPGLSPAVKAAVVHHHQPAPQGDGHVGPEQMGPAPHPVGHVGQAAGVAGGLLELPRRDGQIHLQAISPLWFFPKTGILSTEYAMKEPPMPVSLIPDHLFDRYDQVDPAWLSRLFHKIRKCRPFMIPGTARKGYCLPEKNAPKAIRLMISHFFFILP